MVHLPGQHPADRPAHQQGPEARPQRVRVTGPPRGTHRLPGEVAREIDADTPIGEIYVGTLLREQLRLAAGTLVALAVTLGALPLLFHLVPELAERRVLGVPVPWVALGAGAYPLLLLLGWSYVRRAEAVEETWAALVAEERE